MKNLLAKLKEDNHLRKVLRGGVPIPNKLNNLTDANRRQLLSHTTVSPSVYAHNDVKRSLNLLYFDKCYICENDISVERYNVEHFLPKKHFSHLGYSWYNLHKACEGCNLAKEKKELLIRDEAGDVVDISLLDPSSEEYSVNDYITFDHNGMAKTKDVVGNADVLGKASSTVLYLNGGTSSRYSHSLPYLRLLRIQNFTSFCVDNLNVFKQRLIELKVPDVEYEVPLNAELISDQKLCQLLINVDNEFLSKEAFFSTSTRCILYPLLKVTYAELKRIKTKMREALGL